MTADLGLGLMTADLCLGLMTADLCLGLMTVDLLAELRCCGGRASVCGMWLRDLATGSSHGMCLRDVSAGCGCGMCQRDVSAGCGCGMWLRDVAAGSSWGGRTSADARWDFMASTAAAESEIGPPASSMGWVHSTPKARMRTPRSCSLQPLTAEMVAEVAEPVWIGWLGIASMRPDSSTSTSAERPGSIRERPKAEKAGDGAVGGGGSSDGGGGGGGDEGGGTSASTAACGGETATAGRAALVVADEISIPSTIGGGDEWEGAAGGAAGGGMTSATRATCWRVIGIARGLMRRTITLTISPLTHVTWNG